MTVARPLLPLVITVLAGCAGSAGDTGPAGTTAPPPFDEVPPRVDADGDGYAPEEGDCDDADPTVHPLAEEICDGLDQNCNGLVDEGLPDADADGVPDCLEVEDCDGLDNDGDGLVDEDFPDANGDGVPDCAAVESCNGVDDDANGVVDDGFDADGDGFSPCAGEDQPLADCDDADPSIGPLATEVDGNLVDEDCDGMIDEVGWAAGDLVITEVMANPRTVPDVTGEWFEVLNLSGRTLVLDGLTVVSDGDEDAVVSSIDGAPVELPPDAYGVIARSADPAANGGVSPLAVYDAHLSLSNEADTLELFADGLLVDAVSWDIDDGSPEADGASIELGPIFLDATANDDRSLWCVSPEPWAEGSDLGSPGAPNAYCTNYDYDGDGYSQDEGDCDEDDPAIHPGALELAYDGIDNDCNPDTPDDDLDGDGFPVADDCDDLDPLRAPDLPEVCDAEMRDEDCDGLANDDDPDIDAPLVWYYDADGDGVGTDAVSIETCTPPAGYVLEPGDCDDTDPSVYPGVDADLDGFDLCDDCDDGDGLVFPHAWEDPSDGVDNDCDGYVDGADPDTIVTLSLGDDASYLVSLPFNFYFCGTAYSQLYVQSNGRLTLGYSSTSYTESESAFVNESNIAMAWDDLNPSSGGSVSYTVSSEAFAVYFRDVPQYASSDRNTFTAILWANGEVNLHWERLDTGDFIAGWSCGRGGTYWSSDLTSLYDALPAWSPGIGAGTENFLYELDAPDIDGRGFPFCMRRGTDGDGDGWTPDCGDLDDTDPAVHP